MNYRLLVLDEDTTESFYEMKSGQMVSHRYNPMKQLLKLGIKAHSMPRDLVYYYKKSKEGEEQKPVFLHERGCFALVAFDENGNLINRMGGQKPVFLDMRGIKQLLAIFSGGAQAEKKAQAQSGNA